MTEIESSNETQEPATNEAPQTEAKIITILDTELEELKSERQDFKNKYLLLLADTENARKRLAKEKLDAAQYYLADFVLEVLQPIDNMENALKFAENMSDEVRNWAVGFQMILGQFKDSLEAKGVRPFSAMGMAFDPHQHEAVESEESEEHAADQVLEEFSRGYRMGDRIIRPARVKVSKAPKLVPVQDEKEAEISEQSIKNNDSEGA